MTFARLRTCLLPLLTRLRRPIRVLAAILLMAPLLGSCYVPDDFLAELRIAANGDYALAYRGKVIWAPLVEEIRSGNLTAEEIRTKEEIIRRDLARDSNFREIKPLGGGAFEVVYDRMGRFTGTRQVSFPRRGVEILYMELRTNGKLYVRAVPTARVDQQEQLAKLGLRPAGRFRVLTNAKVAGHNAEHLSHGVPGYPDWSVYDWTIDGFEKVRPSMTIDLMVPQELPKYGK